ncbi:helix-turn-helix domain-containing protein [Streptomyces sp. AS02]|uniref:helix-turn-helix domain-containing protein n=1 Tax=Streptomyces sp. AS02 TaxID=2938946 RepID=UPI002021C867|nr:helix-turn-helix domain-containing protein [Streptomyces sp. AS02]MCL8014955.1 helix-turn-helix domain-containing protein [Streptomyces sp. AS02]
MVKVTDPRAVRALTHPVRFLAMEELYTSQRPCTASELARKADVLPGSMTYHLTVLEKFGLVRRADTDEEGDGRERPWLACGADFSIIAGGVASDRDGALLLEQRLQPVSQRMHELLRRSSAPRPAELGYVIAATARMVLDAAERRAMRDEIEHIWLKYQQLSAGREEDATRRSTRIFWTVLPENVEDLGPDAVEG